MAESNTTPVKGILKRPGEKKVPRTETLRLAEDTKEDDGDAKNKKLVRQGTKHRSKPVGTPINSQRGHNPNESESTGEYQNSDEVEEEAPKRAPVQRKGTFNPKENESKQRKAVQRKATLNVREKPEWGENKPKNKSEDNEEKREIKKSGDSITNGRSNTCSVM